jgi:hypothetical protein
VPTSIDGPGRSGSGFAVQGPRVGLGGPFSVSNLASLLYANGRLAEAEPLYRRALEARERTLGAEHMDTLSELRH